MKNFLILEESERIKKFVQKSYIFEKIITDMLERPPKSTAQEDLDAFRFALTSEIQNINSEFPILRQERILDGLVKFGYLYEIQLNKVKRSYTKSDRFDSLIK